jgi:hypothetical protein
MSRSGIVTDEQYVVSQHLQELYVSKIKEVCYGDKRP